MKLHGFKFIVVVNWVDGSGVYDTYRDVGSIDKYKDFFVLKFTSNKDDVYISSSNFSIELFNQKVGTDEVFLL